MNSIEDLKYLIATSTVPRAILHKMIADVLKSVEHEKAPRKKSVPPTHCTVYTRVQKNYTCQHCGHRWLDIIEIKKGEALATLTIGSHIQIITSESPAEVDCISRNCSRCKDFVSRLSREELERRYLELVRG